MTYKNDSGFSFYIKRYFILLYQQIFALCKKNLLLTIRSPQSLIVRLLAPSIFIALMWIIIHVATQQATRIHNPIVPVSLNIPKCQFNKCRSLFYYPDTEETYKIMSNVAEWNNLAITPFQQTPSDADDISPFSYYPISDMYFNPTHYYGGIAARLANDTFQGGWNSNGVVVFNLNVSSNASLVDHEVTTYTFLYNDTQKCNFFQTRCIEESNFNVQIQVNIEKALIAFYDGKLVPDMEVSTKKFPNSNSLTFLYVAEGMEQVFIYCGLTFSLVFIMNQICSEKEAGLRGYMNVIGLRNSSFWISWFIDHFSLYIVSVIVILILGFSSGISIFKNVSPGVWIALVIVYGISLVMWAFAWTTILPGAKSANIMGFILFLFALALAITAGTLNSLMYALWSEGAYKIIGNVPMMLFVFPPFHLIKIILDIQTITNLGMFKTNEPGNFDWSSMHLRPNQTTTDYDRVPAPIDNLYYLVANIFIYLVVLIVLDLFVPSDNHRPTYSLLHFFKSFSKSDTEDVSEYQSLVNNEVNNDEDLRNERDFAHNSLNLALRVDGMTKIYYKWFGGLIQTPTDVKSLNNFYFGAETGSIVALLGHNGAGKSTLINTLIGVHKPTLGTAYIFGNDVRFAGAEISELVGMCPQEDVLWSDLTAREHLQILSKLKYSSRFITNEEIEKRLEDVRLLKVSNNRAGTFSGGMKRRLSVAISTIGNPKIILLDEPTTGMDPRNRRYIWQMIQRIKSDKLIILTTHSMEEADVLGEKIGIMSKGQLRCIGNPLHLKSKFGSGYRLSLICDESNVPMLKETIQNMLPEAMLREENAGSLIYSLASIDNSSMTDFWSYLQNIKQNNLVRDWGIYNTTLEDVFLKVTREHH